jgi:translation initiation factor IF-3
VGCQVFDSIKAEEHADLGTDLWILAFNTARVVHEESRPSGIMAPDQAAKMSEKSVANLVKIGGKSMKEIG